MRCLACVLYSVGQGEVLPMMGGSNSPTRITQPSKVAGDRSIPVSRALSVERRWSAYLLTAVSITTRSLARPLSMIRAGSGAH
jgi:hypothetical protein